MWRKQVRPEQANRGVATRRQIIRNQNPHRALLAEPFDHGAGFVDSGVLAVTQFHLSLAEIRSGAQHSGGVAAEHQVAVEAGIDDDKQTLIGCFEPDRWATAFVNGADQFRHRPPPRKMGRSIVNEWLRCSPPPNRRSKASRASCQSSPITNSPEVISTITVVPAGSRAITSAWRSFQRSASSPIKSARSFNRREYPSFPHN